MTCLAGLDPWIAVGSIAFIGGAVVFGVLLWAGLSRRAKKG